MNYACALSPGLVTMSYSAECATVASWTPRRAAVSPGTTNCLPWPKRREECEGCRNAPLSCMTKVYMRLHLQCATRGPVLSHFCLKIRGPLVYWRELECEPAGAQDQRMDGDTCFHSLPPDLHYAACSGRPMRLRNTFTDSEDSEALQNLARGFRIHVQLKSR